VLYFGSTTTGKIYKFGNSTSDDGSAINAYWKSKNYPGDDVFLKNNYRQLDILANQNSGQTLTVSYSVDASTASSSFSVPLSPGTTILYKKLLPNTAVGSLINVQFSDNTTTSSWEVLGYHVRFEPLTYQPSR
jgi:hypothetical protein